MQLRVLKKKSLERNSSAQGLALKLKIVRLTQESIASRVLKKVDHQRLQGKKKRKSKNCQREQ